MIRDAIPSKFEFPLMMPALGTVRQSKKRRFNKTELDILSETSTPTEEKRNPSNIKIKFMNSNKENVADENTATFNIVSTCKPDYIYTNPLLREMNVNIKYVSNHDHTYSTASKSLRKQNEKMSVENKISSKSTTLQSTFESGIEIEKEHEEIGKKVKGKLLTPKRTKMSKLIKSLRIKNCRLKTKLKKFEIMKSAFTCNFKDASSVAEAMNIAAKCKQNSSFGINKKYGRRYSNFQKEFALSLYFCSSKAYKYCSRFVPLPTIRSIKIWLNKIQIKPGFNENIFLLLSNRVKNLKEQDKVCSLLLDEMSIKANLSYDQSHDKIAGFEDYGEFGSGKQIANNALVFMVKGIAKKWKQPIAYFLSKNAASAEQLQTLISVAIEKLNSIGLHVRVIISDQGPTNQQMFKFFNVTPEKPYTEISGNRIFFLFDSPHLLKSIRNNLINYNFKIDENIVKWKYISDFYDGDSQQNVREAPKLTHNHIHLHPFAKMRVPLAAEVLSHSVAAGIYSCVARGRLPAEAAYTGEFIDKIDSLFDIFNIQDMHSPKILRTPINAASPHWEYLKICKELLQKMYVLNCKSALPCISGWRLNIESLCLIWEMLEQEFKYKFLLTSRLNQDALENLFSIIRYRGGHRDNPDSMQFRAAFKQVLVQNLLEPTENSNCTEYKKDKDEMMLKINNFIETTNTTKWRRRNQQNLKESFFMRPSSLLSPIPNFEIKVVDELSSDNVLFYISGYLCKKVLQKHSCDRCKNLLLCENQNIEQSRDLFTSFKAYSTDKGDFGGLMVPSNYTFELIKTCEKDFLHQFERFKHERDIKQSILSELILNLNCREFVQNDLHCSSVLEKIIQLFVPMRLHYLIKFLNQQFTNSIPNKHKNRKAKKLLHQ